MALKVGIYIYGQAEVLDFAGPYEVLSTANRLAGDPALFDIYLVSESGGEVKARGGLRVQADFSIRDCPPLDMLVIAGGYHVEEMENAPVLDWLRRIAPATRILASVCTGVFLLARAGLIKNRSVTTHWEDQADLKQRFPDLDVVADVRWVDQGTVVTSGGISAGIDMSLHLVSRLHGRELAEKTARQMEFAWSG